MRQPKDPWRIPDSQIQRKRMKSKNQNHKSNVSRAKRPINIKWVGQNATLLRDCSCSMTNKKIHCQPLKKATAFIEQTKFVIGHNSQRGDKNDRHSTYTLSGKCLRLIFPFCRSRKGHKPDIYPCLPPGRIWHKVFLIVEIREEEITQESRLVQC